MVIRCIPDLTLNGLICELENKHGGNIVSISVFCSATDRGYSNYLFRQSSLTAAILAVVQEIVTENQAVLANPTLITTTNHFHHCIQM